MNPTFTDTQLEKIAQDLENLAVRGVAIGADVVRIGAIGDLLQGLSALVAALILIRLCVSMHRAAAMNADGLPGDPVPLMGALFGGVFSLFLGVFALSQLLDVWNYVALTNPKLALAHQILSRWWSQP